MRRPRRVDMKAARLSLVSVFVVSVFVVSAFVALSAVASGRAVAAPTGKLCFVRAENDGPKNPHPVWIWGTRDGGHAHKLVRVKGTKKACGRVAPGKWSLEARSARPDDPKLLKAPTLPKAPNPNECRSFALVVDVTEGQPVNVSVAPLGRGATTLCGWTLE
jgi:hypothetical protein